MSSTNNSNVFVPLIDPQIVCGQLHPDNRASMDWSSQGPLAFGCQKFVVVVDPANARNLQTLERHKANVTRVCWAPQVYHCNVASPYILCLASIDTTSTCIVWDIGQATPTSQFSLGNRTVVDAQWITTNDSCQNQLAVLLSPNVLTVWNADNGTKINRIIFSETVFSLTFNPFQPQQLLLVSQDYFVYISDFSPQRSLTNTGKKLYMNVPKQKHRGRGVLPRRLLSGEDASGTEDNLSLTDCLQVAFSPAVRHHLLLLFSREILILDTDVMQAVGSVFVERNHSPFIRFSLCKQRDALYCLHENGSISFRVRSPVEFPSNTALKQEDFRVDASVHYDIHCISEPFRISKSCVPYTLAVCPTSEKEVGILTSDGKVMFWNCIFEKVGRYGQHLEEGGEALPLTLLSALPSGASGEELNIGEESEGLTLSNSIAPHWFTPPEGPDVYHLLKVEMVLTGVYYGLVPNPMTIRMCPPITNRNWKNYKCLLAIGNSVGVVQIINLYTKQPYREFSIHTCPVKGIEWVGLDQLLTFGYPPAINSGQVRNELTLTHISTGRVVHLKKGENGYQPPITAIRVSPQKNYFAVNFKDSPPEFWDCKTLKLIRVLQSTPSVFTALEWASANAFPGFAPKTHSNSPNLLNVGGLETQHKATKEVMAVLDIDANIHQFIVEGTKFQSGPMKSISTTTNHPSTMCWKNDLLMIGDIDGMLLTWEMKSGNMKYIGTPRGSIRRLKFAPGKGNMKYQIHYTNRLDIRDLQEETFLSQIKWSSKDDLSVEEIEWGSSDRPVLLMSDGTVRVYNLSLTICNAPCNTNLIESTFYPQFSLPQAAFRLKSILQHQPWNVQYSLDHSLDYSELDVDPIEKALFVLLKTLPQDYKQELLDTPIGTPYRSILTSLLFGDERELEFWSIATYYLIREKHRRQDPFYKMYVRSSYNPKAPTSDIIQPDSSASTSIESSLKHSLEDLLQEEEGDIGPEERLKRISEMIQEANQKTWSQVPPLDLGHDLFIDQDIFQRYQLHRVVCHDAHRHSPSHNKRCAETLILLGQADRAVQLLLETDSTNPEYYTDALKACLAATIRSSGASQSTIKLVATNLIANSKLLEGVQLLCLIDKGLDACRYLQTYSEWSTSVWLAKSTLGEKEMAEVFGKWVDNLMASNQKNTALLVMLSLGQFMKVIETLYSMRYFDQAAIFTECCLEYGLITRNKDSAPLIEAVFLEYARLLASLGLSRGMRYYCNLAGNKGSMLLEEQFSPQKREVK